MRAFTAASSSGAMCMPPDWNIGNDGWESTGASIAGSSIIESAKLPVKHMPIAPTPLPPESGSACAARARSQRVTGLDWFAANESSPVTQWLRALAAHAHPICGGKGVGAIGMCFTGNFALSMMLEPAMLAPVLSQPSLPMGKAGGMHIAPDELAAVKKRMDAEDLTVLAYRFEGDAFCRAERFAAYQEALGDRFVGRVLPDASANPDAPMRNPHSVVTLHLIDRAGEPTVQARDEILGFFRQRLLE